jgi:signal peptidase I
VTSLALLAVVPALLGCTSTVVMSDSMAPGIRTGDVVVVRAVPIEEVHAGQVLLVDDPSFPGRLRLHRLDRRVGDQLLLKGDANPRPDPTPVAPAAVHGVGFLRVPWIGLPVVWLRAGETGPVVATAAAVIAAAAVVSALDRSGGPTAGVLRGAVRFLRRTRARRLAQAGAVGLLVLAPAAHLVAVPGDGTSWAVFTSASTSPGNTLAAGTWCPALPRPVLNGATTGTAPSIAYGFSSTGLAEANVGSLGANYGAALSSTSLRQAGTCSAGSSPSVQFAGGESIVSNQAYAAASTATSTLWFDPTSASGVLYDLGGSTASAATADRQLYFTSGGGLAFAVRDGSSVTECTVTTSVSLGTWHFAAVAYDGTAKTFTVYFDGQSTSCTASFSTVPTASLRARIGNDATIATDAAGGSFIGSIDEVYTWAAVVPASGITTIYNGGH